jgi:hypothetical protein
VDDIKMDHRDTGWGGIDWFNAPQHEEKWRALVNTGMVLQFP